MPKINETGLALIEQFEGCVLTAYQDEGGVWTIGYGHTGPDVGPGDIWTKGQAEAALLIDLASAESTVQDDVEVQLTPNQFSALVSFVYNIGAGNFGSSTLLRQLNASNFHGAASSFLDWVYVNNIVVAGLVRRRQAEQKLFLTP